MRPARINKSMNIAFIGLGNMGSAMATNLIKAGHTLSVFNRTRVRADALKPLGRASLTRQAKPLPAPTRPAQTCCSLREIS
jgi:pyrroline-5-carboxylate reductase